MPDRSRFRVDTARHRVIEDLKLRQGVRYYRKDTDNGGSPERGSWQSVSSLRTGESGTAAGVPTVLGKAIQTRFEFYARAGQRGACSFTSRNAPARLVPGVDLLEDFSTMMRGLRVHVLFNFSCGVINCKGNPFRMTSSDAFVIN